MTEPWSAAAKRSGAELPPSQQAVIPAKTGIQGSTLEATAVIPAEAGIQRSTLRDTNERT